jgi:putative endonuclease
VLNLFQHPFLCLFGPCEAAGVYILASRKYGTLYIGVTSDLIARLYQHRTGQVKGFTSKYAVYRLVRFEQFETMHDAIAREKQLKRWHRPWKINLIESENPDWHDLAPDLGLPPLASS